MTYCISILSLCYRKLSKIGQSQLYDPASYTYIRNAYNYICNNKFKLKLKHKSAFLNQSWSVCYCCSNITSFLCLTCHKVVDVRVFLDSKKTSWFFFDFFSSAHFFVMQFLSYLFFQEVKMPQIWKFYFGRQLWVTNFWKLR